MTDTKLEPIIEYYDNGMIKLAYSVDEIGNKQGPHEWYDESGYLKEKCTFKDGKKDGLEEAYLDDGRVWDRSIFKMGKELYGKEAKEYLKEQYPIEYKKLYEEKEEKKAREEAKEIRKGLNNRLAQMDKQMAPTQLRQAVKRAEVAKFRKNHPDKHAGR